MKKLKIIFQLLIYVSIVCLAYYLSRIDYLSFRNFHFNTPLLIFSVLVLWTGFFVSSLAWKHLLNYHGVAVNYKTSMVSEGLNIFTKYIPGKIMIVLGRAGFISHAKGKGLKETSLVSLKAQVLSILAGLVLGLGALPGLSTSVWVYLLYLVFTISLILFFNNKKIHHLLLKMVTRISGKQFDLPLVKIREVLPALLHYMTMWLFWSGGFYLMLLSVGTNAGFQSLFLLSLANTLGVIAVISPGGLGIREGIILVFLYNPGISIETATAIAVLGRLWYMSGEVMFFLVAVIVNKATKRHVISHP